MLTIIKKNPNPKKLKRFFVIIVLLQKNIGIGNDDEDDNDEDDDDEDDDDKDGKEPCESSTLQAGVGECTSCSGATSLSWKSQGYIHVPSYPGGTGK